MSFYKPAKNGHIASSAEAKSTADLEMKVTCTPSESRLLPWKDKRNCQLYNFDLIIIV